MLEVIHLENSRSDRVIWLLEELELEYVVARYERDPKTQRASAELKALHPYAKSPMLRDGDRLLIESGAIFEYVLGRSRDGGLVPDKGDADWPDYLQWLHFAEGSAMLPLLLDHFQAAGLCGEPGQSPMAAMARGELDKLYGYLESVLAERRWFAGDRFTAADIMMGWFVDMVDGRGELASYPAMGRYLAALRARPAYQRAKERG